MISLSSSLNLLALYRTKLRYLFYSLKKIARCLNNYAYNDQFHFAGAPSKRAARSREKYQTTAGVRNWNSVDAEAA